MSLCVKPSVLIRNYVIVRNTVNHNRLHNLLQVIIAFSSDDISPIDLGLSGLWLVRCQVAWPFRAIWLELPMKNNWLTEWICAVFQSPHPTTSWGPQPNFLLRYQWLTDTWPISVQIVLWRNKPHIGGIMQQDITHVVHLLHATDREVSCLCGFNRKR